MATTAIKEEAVHRDAGLAREIGVWSFAATIINVVVGGGIFAAPAALAGSVGAWAPFALLACGIAMGAIVLCCAEAGSRVPSSGGTYAYVEAAFGRGPGFVCGMMLWLSCVLAAGGIAAAFADAIVALYPVGPAGVQRVVLIVAVMMLVTGINLRGAREGARFAGVMTVVKLVPLLVFVGVGAFWIDPQNLKPTGEVDPGSFGAAIILSIFTFSGMETMLSASGEVSRPEKTVPRALMLAMAGVLLLYIAIQTVAQGLLGPQLATAKEPLAQALGVVHPALIPLIAVGAAISRGAWLGSDVLGAPRILFAFARDGFLPVALGQVNDRTQVPTAAILTHATIGTALALAGEFTWLVLLSALATAPIYIGACLAAVKLRREDVQLIGPAFRVPGLGIASAVGVLSMIALIALGQPNEIIGLFAAIGLSTLLYFLRR
ncbi:APC family permease [Sphingomonas tabacisoli]|uniref:Arginine/agmatine antiporter n=1 Tax=Sphingomonas tabacisoli TaxID=2249466 RepID=A0ABW4I5T1_9SPHN